MSNSLTITGTIKQINPTEKVNDTFSKRLFVLSVQDGNYTNDVALQFVKDKTDLLDNYATGDAVRVHFNTRSREYNGKWYTDNTAYGIAREGSQATNYATDANSAGMVTNAPTGGDADSQLPF